MKVRTSSHPPKVQWLISGWVFCILAAAVLKSSTLTSSAGLSGKILVKTCLVQASSSWLVVACHRYKQLNCLSISIAFALQVGMIDKLRHCTDFPFLFRTSSDRPFLFPKNKSMLGLCKNNHKNNWHRMASDSSCSHTWQGQEYRKSSQKIRLEWTLG